MAYERYVPKPNGWVTGDPITQELMNHIEKGIDDAHDLANVNKTNISAITSDVSTLRTDMDFAVESARQAQSSADTALTQSQQGMTALSALDPFIKVPETGEYVTDLLRSRIVTDEGNIATAAQNVYNLQVEVEGARGKKTYYGNGAVSQNLAERLNDMDMQISSNKGTITTIGNDYTNAKGGYYASLQDRLNSIDGDSTNQGTFHDKPLASHVLDLENILINAPSSETSQDIREKNVLVSTANSTSYNSLDARLEADEVKINNAIIHDEIQDNLTSTNVNAPLSANQGRILKTIIGAAYDVNNTVATGIINAENNAKNHADTNKVDKTDIYNGVDYTTDDQKVLDARVGKTLQDQIDTISSGLNTADTGLVARIAALETEVDNANGDGTLDDRFDAIETNVTTIATELNMLDNQGAMKDTQTRVDDLDAHVTSLATELGMISNGQIIDTNTRVDQLENRVDAIDNVSTGSIKALADRVSTAENDIDTLEADLNTESTGLKSRMTVAENDIDNAQSDIGVIQNDLNNVSTGLKARVTTLENEPKSATSIIDINRITYNVETGIPTIYTDSNKTTEITPTETVDYLLENTDEKYYYWKYIGVAPNGSWNLISGAGNGGGGNTTGIDLTPAEYEAIEEYQMNTDYYVARADGVHHYRHVMVEDIEQGEEILTEIEIGQFVDVNKIKRYNIATENAVVDGEDVTYLNLYQYDYDELNNNIDTERVPLTQIILPKGGGGAASSTVNKLIRIGDQTIQKIVGSQILLRVFYSSVDSSSNETNSGDYILKTGNTTIASGVFNSGAADADLTQGWQDNTTGYYEFDVTDYCSVGNTTFNLAVTVNGTTLGKSWTVNIIDLHLESTAPDVLLISTSESYNFPYTPFGALNKTLYVIIDDDTEHKTTVSLSSVTSGRATQVTIPAQSHGAHKIELYLEATVGGVLQQTESIIREYIWYNAESTTTILASPKNGETITAQQYSTIEIPYQVYKKDATNITLEYYVDDAVTPFDTITLEDTNTGILSYLASTQGEHTVTIKVQGENISISTTLNITELNIDVSPIDGAIIDFDPTMLTNSSTNRLPSWTVGNNTYSLIASDNFNWSDDTSGGGYKTDRDGKAFVIKAGSYVDLNYPMFAGTSSNNILTKGAEMKIIFKVNAVRDVNAIWFQNTGSLTGKTVGIQLGAHSGWLKTDKATDTATSMTNTEYPAWVSGTTYSLDEIVVYKDTIYKCIAAIEAEDAATNPKELTNNWLSMGKIETEVLATNSYLYMPYSEEDKIELDININKYNANTDTNFIMSYEDGVPSKAYAYEYGNAGDGLYHNNTIRIGSNDCDIYIYHLRIYDKSLTTADILQNFIADGNGISEKVERYNRNCIYWDSTQEQYFTSPSATAVLDPIKLAEVMPDVKVLMLDTPVFTVGKKNFVQNSSLRCIHADGGNVYRSRGDADNWLFTNGFHSGQGTTSDNYGQSARNVDFLFMVDGVHYPTKKKNMGTYTPNTDYVSKVYIGEDASTWNGTSWAPAREAEENEICTYDPSNGKEGWKGDNCKVSLTETSVPNNYFNLKVNVASSENVNNALFQKRYDDFLAYNSPAQTNQIQKHRAAYAALGLNPNNIKVKNSMEFVPAVLFVRENQQDQNGNPVGHTEFNDCNWHFYALGNIGDSKKTDYTRAYDPDDMNEFTLENSDNNTKNGQFQSGVYMDGNTRVVERNESGSNTMQFIWGLSDEEWNATREPTAEEIAAAAEEDGIDVRLPNGQVYVNYRHRMLYAEPFDGDHSFEFRYACKGDYRDGDLINDTTGLAKAQEKLNIGVFYAFYDWLVMSDDATFKAEASQWIVPSAMEFFYAYTHYYTMMDNRAKNTFWHFAKTGTHVEVSHPVAALLHVYDELINGEYVRTEDTTIDENKTYYTEYAFDLWAYDMDTALGIDNNGALVFPYGKEDSDYRTEGDSLSGYAFNGAGSIFWRRIKTSFANEIRDIMTQTSACFNADDLINEFDAFQNCFPEEIWRLDIERKYIRTFTGEEMDKSVTIGKQNPRFLTSMMQGRKKYQRRQWIRNQSVYFNSKYRLPDIIANENTLEFNATTPDVPLWVSGASYIINDYVKVKAEPFNEEKPRYEVYRCIEANNDSIFTSSKWHKSVTPSYYLQLTPYQDMYLNVQLGNGNYQNSYMTDGPATLRAKAGQTYTFDLFGSYQETRIYINGAKYLSGISNLGPMYPYKFDLRGLDHLKVLNIGVEESDYKNTKFDELELPNFMPLLETVNVKNCHSLGKTLSLSTANNIRTIEAASTIISGVSLPDYTNIETLHLPSTVIGLNLYSARFLNDFKIYNSAGENDYSTLYKLHIYDSDYSSNIDWIDIATTILQKQSLETELSLLKLNIATIDNIQALAPFMDFKNPLENAGGIMNFSGTIEITGAWSVIEAKEYTNNVGYYTVGANDVKTWHPVIEEQDKNSNPMFPDLQLIIDPEQEQAKHKVTYRYNNKETIIYVNDGTTAPEIYPSLISEPTKESTPEYSYIFGSRDDYDASYIPYSGWRKSTSSTPLTGAPIITEDTILVAYFIGTKRQYYVRWWLSSGKLVATSARIDYGTGETLEAPTIKAIHEKGFDTCSVTNSSGMISYSIFKGWEHLPISNWDTVDGSTNYFDIYGLWETGNVSISNLFASTTNLTPIQLLVWSILTDEDKVTYGLNSKIDQSTSVTYRLGQDCDEEATVLVSDSGNPLYLNGTSNSFSATTISGESIKPLNATNNAFTFVIDYTFNDTTYATGKNYAVLASCYYSQNGVRNGFAVFKNINTGKIEVGFGDMYRYSDRRKAISNTNNANMRNILVIRHAQNSPTIQIYSGLGDEQTIPVDAPYMTSISQAGTSTFSAVDAILNIGQIVADTESIANDDSIRNTWTKAVGTVYWSKFWNKDLGLGECKRLASWPHEYTTLSIAYSHRDPNVEIVARAREDTIPNPTLYLASSNALMHGLVVQNRVNVSSFNNNLYSWENAPARTLCNNRLLFGLPIQLQSILCKSQVSSYPTEYYVENAQSGGIYRRPEYCITTRDYLFAYSVSNIVANNSDYEQEDLINSPFAWRIPANVQLYDYDSSNTIWNNVNTNGNELVGQYFNLRFPYKPIQTSTIRIYRAEDGTAFSSNPTIAASIGTDIIRSGDIYLEGANAYIYVSNQEINAYGLNAYLVRDYARFNGLVDNDVTHIDSTSLGRGGWISATNYWTRSLISGGTSYTKFADVSVDGSVNISNVSTDTYGEKVSYILTI